MFAESFVHGRPLIVSILIALGVGLAIGMINGFLITVVGVNALITTIGTMGITRAFAFIVTNGSDTSFNGFTTLGLSRPFVNIPWMVWFFFAAVIATWLTLRVDDLRSLRCTRSARTQLQRGLPGSEPDA